MPRGIQISSNESNHDIGVAILSFLTHWAIYIIIFALVLMIFALLMKFLRDLESDITIHDDTNRLLPKDVNYAKYGTVWDKENEDLETRKWNSSGSSEDLYNEKICVICYEGQRDCFFVPCGHCVSCYACGERIIEEEIKTCPICRMSIHKVRKLFDSQNQDPKLFQKNQKKL